MPQLRFVDKFRSVLARIWQRTELIVKIGVKFLAYYYMFHLLANAEMFSHLPETFILHSKSIQLVLALVSTLLPNRAGVLLALLMIVYSVFQTSLIGAILVGLALLLLYAAASSLFPDHVYLVPLMIVSIHYKFYLALPLFCGMYIGASAIVPVLIGIVGYAVLEIVPLFMHLEMGALDTLPQLITDASKSGISTIMANEQIVYLMVVSSLIILLGTLLCKMRFNFGRYVALGVAGVFGTVALVTGVAQGRIEGTPSLLLTCILVLVVMLILELLKVSVSYEGSQSVEFEDDNYIYQVRMIPKMSKYHTSMDGDVVIRKAPQLGKKGKLNKDKAKAAASKVRRPQQEAAAPAAAAAAVAATSVAVNTDTLEAVQAAKERDRVLLFGEEETKTTIVAPVKTKEPEEAEPAMEFFTEEEEEAPSSETTVVPEFLEDKTVAIHEGFEELDKTQILEEATKIVEDPKTPTIDTANLNFRNVLSDEDEPLDLFEEYDEKHS